MSQPIAPGDRVELRASSSGRDPLDCFTCGERGTLVGVNLRDYRLPNGRSIVQVPVYMVQLDDGRTVETQVRELRKLNLLELIAEAAQ